MQPSQKVANTLASIRPALPGRDFSSSQAVAFLCQSIAVFQRPITSF